MPYVSVKLIDDSVSLPQKAEVIRRITDVLVEVLDKNPETTFVVIEEVDMDNWGVAGQTVRSRRVQQRSQLNAKPS